MMLDTHINQYISPLRISSHPLAPAKEGEKLWFALSYRWNINIAILFTAV